MAAHAPGGFSAALQLARVLADTGSDVRRRAVVVPRQVPRGRRKPAPADAARGTHHRASCGVTRLRDERPVVIDAKLSQMRFV